MNTEGGLVRIYSKNPLAYDGTDVKIGIGSRLYRNFEITNYLKLSDNSAISFSGFYNGNNGFIRNQTTGKRADDINEAGGKIRIVNQYSPRLTYDFIADYQYVNQAGFPYGELDLQNGHTASPTMNRDCSYQRNILNSALNIRYTSGDITFNSTTSYQFLSDRMNMDQDYTAADMMHLSQKQLQNGITQEFALKGRINKNWKYTTGLFGTYQWLRTDAPVYFDKDFTTMMASNIQSAIYNAITESMSGKFMSIPGMTEERAKEMAQATINKAGGIEVSDLSMSVPGMFHTPQFNLGVFHESQIDLNKCLTMTIGLRYDYSLVKVKYETSAIMAMNASVMGITASRRLSSILTNTKSNSFNQVLPKLGFTWRINDNGSNIYALVNKGYRSGGYNIQMFSDILQTELMANSKEAMKSDYDIQHTDALLSRQVSDDFDSRCTDFARRLVDDTAESDIVPGVRHDGHIRVDVLDFLAVIEALAAHDLMRDARTGEIAFDGGRLGVHAVEDGVVGQMSALFEVLADDIRDMAGLVLV